MPFLSNFLNLKSHHEGDHFAHHDEHHPEHHVDHPYHAKHHAEDGDFGKWWDEHKDR